MCHSLCIHEELVHGLVIEIYSIFLFLLRRKVLYVRRTLRQLRCLMVLLAVVFFLLDSFLTISSLRNQSGVFLPHPCILPCWQFSAGPHTLFFRIELSPRGHSKREHLIWCYPLSGISSTLEYPLPQILPFYLYIHP